MMRGLRVGARASTVCVLTLALAACSLFGPSKPSPTKLQPLTAQMAGRQVWKHSIGKVRFPLAVAVTEGRFTVADDSGVVTALDANTGQPVWRADVDAKLSAGVGSDGRFASVVTRDNELITLDAGKVAWRQKLASRVVTAPLVAGERVFVLGVDRSVQAFDALDGRKLWAYQRPSEALSLVKAGVLLPYKDTLVVGQGPKLAGLDPLRGTLRWDAAVASPRGTNEVERLADLLAPAARVGELVCARAFQSAVACVNAERGSVVWTRNASGTDGVAADDQVVVGADASDRLTAWRIADGSVTWSNETMLYRDLSAPRTMGDTVVMGDLDGFVHWLSRDTGKAVLRLPTDGSAIQVTPVLSGSTLLVVTRDGGVFAFRRE